jgi:hypothetical protein
MRSMRSALLIAVALGACARTNPNQAACASTIDQHMAREDAAYGRARAQESPEMRAIIDRVPPIEQERKHRDETECARRVLAGACVDDAWTEAARTCMARVDDIADCAREFSAEQQRRIELATEPCEHHAP